jgi:hypothetical protein
MIQRIVKTELNSLIASSKIPSNRLQQTRIISRVGMGKKPARKLRNRRVRNFLINELKNVRDTRVSQSKETGKTSKHKFS